MEVQEKGMETEKQHLAVTQQLIQQEMNRLLRELGLMKQEIVDYRKYLTEEVPQKQYHMMNVGSEVKENKYTQTYNGLWSLVRCIMLPISE